MNTEDSFIIREEVRTHYRVSIVDQVKYKIVDELTLDQINHQGYYWVGCCRFNMDREMTTRFARFDELTDTYGLDFWSEEACHPEKKIVTTKVVTRHPETWDEE